MRKKIQSRPRNASVPKARNSKTAHSKNTAKKKSKKSSVESLHVATPTGTRLEFLKNEGLLAPDEIAADEDRVPLDFTRLDFKMVGAVHSRYAVRHAHAIFRASHYRTRLAYIERDLRIEKAVKRAKLKGKYKTKWELEDALLGDHGIKELEERALEFESRLTIIEALASGYEDLRNAASREMFRRGAEKAPND